MSTPPAVPPMRDPVSVLVERADLPLLAAALLRFAAAHTTTATAAAKEVEDTRQPGEDIRPAAVRVMQLLATARTLQRYGEACSELAAGITLPAAHRHLQVVLGPAGDDGGAPVLAVAGGRLAAPPRPAVSSDQLSDEQRTQQTLAELAASRANGTAVTPPPAPAER